MTNVTTIQAIDPVCGMTVEPDDAVSQGLTTEHKGHGYYFCSADCMAEFGEVPDRYMVFERMSPPRV